MKIGIDIDEVIAEFTKSYLDFHNGIHKTNFKFEDLYSYYLEKPFNTTKEKIVKSIFDFYETENFANLVLVEGAKELVSELSKEHEIFFVTARPLRIKEKTKNFIRNNFPEIPLKIFHTGDMFGEKKTKAEVCLENGICYLIEDNENYALDCANKGVRVFLLEKPWNKSCEEHTNITKINHLKEILEKLK